jgi:hypothetical protein
MNIIKMAVGIPIIEAVLSMDTLLSSAGVMYTVLPWLTKGSVRSGVGCSVPVLYAIPNCQKNAKNVSHAAKKKA